VRLIGIFSIAALVSLALQTTVPRLLPIAALFPDLVLILAVDLGLRHYGILAAVMAFVIGYATDAFSGSQLGLNALMLTLVFVLAYWLSRVLISNSPAIGAVAVFAGVILQNVGVYLAGSGFAPPLNLTAIMPQTLLQAAVTALITPWVFGITGWADKLVGLRQRGQRE
jgi:rod shape-determining protein MreD